MSVSWWNQVDSTSKRSPVAPARFSDRPNKYTSCKAWYRSGLLRAQAVSSPRLPRVFPKTATVTHPASIGSLKDLQCKAAVEFHTSRAQYGANGASRPALLADH